MRCVALTLGLLLALSTAAGAQPPAVPDGAATPPATQEEPPPPRDESPAEEPLPTEPAEPPAPPRPEGDVVRLKGGGELRDVQVVRVAATGYEIEVAAGKVTVTIPRGQVESVEYDDYDPATDSFSASGADDAPILLEAREMPQQLVNRLSRDISNPEFSFTDRDFISILMEAATRAEVTIKVDESLRTLPVESRQWTYAARPGSTALNLLEALSRDFDTVRVTYSGTEVVVTRADPPPANNAS
jgi:hypothetical protein